MKTQYYTASSLDGFIADTNHSLEWLLQFGDAGESYQTFIADVGALIMGSSTYEWLVRQHIAEDAIDPQPWPYHQPTWVMSSRQLPRIEGANLHFASGDIRPVYAEMVKHAAGKNIWIVGGGDLAGQFYDQRLLHELIITIAPVTLGSGAPLLPRMITDQSLKLLSMQAYGTIFAELRYQVEYPEA